MLNPNLTAFVQIAQDRVRDAYENPTTSVEMMATLAGINTAVECLKAEVESKEAALAALLAVR